MPKLDQIIIVLKCIRLCSTSFLHFCLRGGQEQRDLSFKQFACIPKDTGVYNEDTYFEYTEFISKNNQHGFKDIHAENKTVKAYAVVESQVPCEDS